MSQTARPLLALDIGTSSVKALLAKLGPGNMIEISGVGKAMQHPDNMTAGAISDIAGVAKVAEHALLDAEDLVEHPEPIDTVVGLAGELVKSASTTIKYLRIDASKPIDEREVGSLISKIQKKAEDKARKEFEYDGMSHPDLQLISCAISSIFIDGHRVATPVGFKGKQLDITLYTAFAPLVHISAIETVCMELRLNLITIAVEPFAVARAMLGREVPEDFSATVIDIGGGTTDIAVIDRGGIVDTRMMGIAGRSFTHAISNALHVDDEAAEKLKLHLDDRRIKASVRAKMDKGLKDNLAIWFEGLGMALADQPVEQLPTNIYLSGGGASLEMLSEALATTNWYRKLAFARRPLVNLLQIELLDGYLNNTDVELDHSYATALGLLRVGTDTLNAPGDDTDSLKSRLKRLLRN